MSTQNVQSANQFRSSGHKDATEAHIDRHKIHSTAEGGDFEALLNNRILNHDSVSRAALYDVDDFLCIGSSKARFKLEPDDVRKIYDGLLTSQRQNDPTSANQGEAPKSLTLGSEGRVSITGGDQDHLVGQTDDGKPFIAGQTAKSVLLVEGQPGANVSSLEVLVQSFQSGLQAVGE